jgi:hypothetical protein
MANLKKIERERRQKLEAVDAQSKKIIEYVMLILEAYCSKQIWAKDKTRLEEALILKDTKELKSILSEIL